MPRRLPAALFLLDTGLGARTKQEWSADVAAVGPASLASPLKRASSRIRLREVAGRVASAPAASWTATSGASQVEISSSQAASIPRKRRKRRVDDIGVRVAGGAACQDGLQGVSAAWSSQAASNTSVLAGFTTSPEGILVAAEALVGAMVDYGSATRCVEAIQRFDELSQASQSLSVKQASRHAVRQVAERLGDWLRACESDASIVADHLSQVLACARDEATQFAVIGALGSMALGSQQATAARAIAALQQAAGLEAFHPSTLATDGTQEITRMLCYAMESPAQRNVEAAIDALLWVLDAHDDPFLDEWAQREIGIVLGYVSERNFEVALAKLLQVVERGDQRNVDTAIEVVNVAIKNAASPRLRSIVCTLVEASGHIEPRRYKRLFDNLEIWLIEHPVSDESRVVLEALATVFPETLDDDLRDILVGVVTHVFEESLADDLERPALDALAKMASESDSEDVHERIIDTLHMGLWLGTIGPRNIVRCMQALTKVGIATFSMEGKRSVVSALSHCLWDRAGNEAWLAALAELAISGMAQINASAGDHRSMVAIVEQVGTSVLRGSQRLYIARAIDWLVRDVLSLPEDDRARPAALEAGAVLASSDRIEDTVSSLYEILIEDWSDRESGSLEEFAVFLLSRCSVKGIRRAARKLMQLTVGSHTAWAKYEVVKWMSRALARADQDRVAQVIIRGLAEIAVRARSMGVELLAVDALTQVVSSADPLKARAAIRSLLKVALETEAPDLGQVLGRRLADIVLSENVVHAKIAIRGLLEVSGRSGAAFREQSLDTFVTAGHHPVQPAIRAELQSAIQEMMRLKEQALRDENSRPEARNTAPAA
mmetsp:Transcript_125110/g.361956  ORF Transcript_125110/g.361956 Transcript_125110/m.361956 type:complete len:836 (-) Transcript_125110:53-2560(-)